ncbi:hypothetical protein CPB85DRAFT_376616 [Mucidula mucida]|nr:hypothetical protein CPB85DRAFT_376616 [Mucidula mucida]
MGQRPRQFLDNNDAIVSFPVTDGLWVHRYLSSLKGNLWTIPGGPRLCSPLSSGYHCSSGGRSLIPLFAGTVLATVEDIKAQRTTRLFLNNRIPHDNPLRSGYSRTITLANDLLRIMPASKTPSTTSYSRAGSPSVDELLADLKESVAVPPTYHDDTVYHPQTPSVLPTPSASNIDPEWAYKFNTAAPSIQTRRIQFALSSALFHR